MSLIDDYVQAGGPALQPGMAELMQRSDQGPVWRLCYAIGALCSAHAGQEEPLRSRTRALAERLIGYAQPHNFFGLDYAGMLAQLAADDDASASSTS